MDTFETSCLDRARNDIEQEQDEDLFFDDRLQENKVQVMSAIEGDKANKKKGCFWKYMYGECTNKDCQMDHRDGSLVRFILWSSKGSVRWYG